MPLPTQSGSGLSSIPMIHRLRDVSIKIDSPSGNVFQGFCKAVSIKATKQVIIEFRRNWINYVSLSKQTLLTLESGASSQRFLLTNAMARLDRDKLSILAENVALSGKKASRPSNRHFE